MPKPFKESTTISIQNLSRQLLPEFDTAAVLNDWKLYQNDGDISDIDTDQRFVCYWNAVFLLTSVKGNDRYQLLPRFVKSCLVLAQANADSEHRLLVNARVVTKEISRLEEQTIFGLRCLKFAVKFYDPVNHRSEKIPVTIEMRKSVHLAHSADKARLDQEKEEKKKELKETKRKKGEEERQKNGKEKLLKSRDSLAKNEADILKNPKKAREDLEAANELSDATSKLHDALSSSTVNRQCVSVATMMLDTARNKREQAMKQLKAVGEKRKSLDTKTHKLFKKAIPSAQTPAKKI